MFKSRGGEEQEGVMPQQLAAVVPDFTPFFQKEWRIVYLSELVLGITELEWLAVVWGGSRAGSSLAFLAPPTPTLQAARSLSLLDLYTAQLSFTARSGIRHHQVSPGLFSSQTVKDELILLHVPEEALPA